MKSTIFSLKIVLVSNHCRHCPACHGTIGFPKFLTCSRACCPHLQEQQEWRRKREEESLKNSVLDSAAAARFSTAAALEAAKEKGIAGGTTIPLLWPHCAVVPA